MSEKNGDHEQASPGQGPADSETSISLGQSERQQRVQAETSQEATNKSDNQQQSTLLRFREWLRHEKTFTDWVIAAFTAVLAGASIYQFVIMSAQLDEMRGSLLKSQRPWVNAEGFEAHRVLLPPRGR